MYLYKENKELFRDVSLLTSQKLEVREDMAEKDYYEGTRRFLCTISIRR